MWMIEREHYYRKNGVGNYVAYQAKYRKPDGSRSFVLQRIKEDGSREKGLGDLLGQHLVIGSERSRELMKAVEGILFICEGPKDCESILGLGLPCVAGYATSIAPPFGTHIYSLMSVLTELSIGSQIVCIGDGDDAGRRYAKQMAEACWLSLNEWKDRSDIEIFWTSLEGNDGLDISDVFDGLDHQERIKYLQDLEIVPNCQVRYSFIRSKQRELIERKRRQRLMALNGKYQSKSGKEFGWNDLVNWCRNYAVTAPMEDTSQSRKIDGEVSGPCPLCGGSNRFWVNDRGPWCRKCCVSAVDKMNRKRFLRDLFKIAKSK